MLPLFKKLQVFSNTNVNTADLSSDLHILSVINNMPFDHKKMEPVRLDFKIALCE